MSIFAASGGLDRQLGWCERPESGYRYKYHYDYQPYAPLPGEVMHVDGMSRRIRVVHVRVMRLAWVISSTGYSASLG